MAGIPMKIILLAAVVLSSLWAGKKERVWTEAKVEQCLHEVRNRPAFEPLRPTPENDVTVHESIYVDAGEWLYHVTREVTARGVLRLREGARIEVAAEAKNLIMRIGGKQITAKIAERSRAGAAITPPSSRR